MTLGRYLLVGVFLAFVACIIAGFGLAVFAAARRSGAPVGSGDSSEMALALACMSGSYLVGGVLAATGAWALAPRRTSSLGWALTGGWIAGSGGGCAGLGATLAYVLYEVNLLGFASARAAWVCLVSSAAVLAFVVGPASGLIWHRLEVGRGAQFR